MTSKDFLQHVRLSGRSVIQTQERIDKMSQLLKVAETYSSGGTKWAQTQNRIEELEWVMSSQIVKMVNLKLAAIDAIKSVDSERQKEALELYYLDGLTWEQVAEKMELSDRHVKRLRDAALEKIRVPEKYL